MWGHANIPRTKKLELFNALVVSRLLYGLSTLWLVTAQRRRIDGFYARCLRRLFAIPPAFISRVSNKAVYAKAGVNPLSEQLLLRQLSLLRKAAKASENDNTRRDVFVGECLESCVGTSVRRIGQSPQNWTTELLKVARDRKMIVT